MALDVKALALIKEIMRDAEPCARLSQWEENFLDDMRARVLLHGAETPVSAAQWTVLRTIEGKVYAS